MKNWNSSTAKRGAKQTQNSISKAHLKCFCYAKMCEVFAPDENDAERLTWTPVAITDTLIRRRNPEDTHMRLKILWLDGSTSWVRLSAFQMEHPDLVADYAFKNGIMHARELKWTTLYCAIQREERDEPDHLQEAK